VPFVVNCSFPNPSI